MSVPKGTFICDGNGSIMVSADTLKRMEKYLERINRGELDNKEKHLSCDG